MKDTHLICGGSGFLAEALLPRLKGNIRILARNEGKLVQMKHDHPHIEIFTGDIADEWTVKKAMQGVTHVWHLAAMKSVDIAEKQVFSCINTNVIGTYNLLKESFNTKPKSFLFISTDKAAQVNGVYGATKFLDERLMIEAQEMNPNTTYRTVRYGNVLYSTGSVLCKWKRNMMMGDDVMITDPNMTRFFWTKEQAVDLIFECLEKAQDATPYVPKMKAMRMGDLLEAMMQKYGRVTVKTIGNRGGENLHETMDGKVFSNQVEQFTINEIKEMI